MKRLFPKLHQDYLDSRSTPQEDFIYWFIQRKMTWGQRWLLVIVLNFSLQPFFFNLRVLLWLFRIGLVLGIVYILGHTYFFFKDRHEQKNKD